MQLFAGAQGGQEASPLPGVVAPLLPAKLAAHTTNAISCVSQRLLVIVIEFAQSSTSRIKRRDGRLRLSERGRAECASERLDVSLCAQAGDPAFLNTLCFLLKQSLLDIVPRFGK